MVVSDPKMTLYHGKDKIESYILTLMNIVSYFLIFMFFSLSYIAYLKFGFDVVLCYLYFGGQVAELFRDESIGNSVNILVVRIVVLIDEQVM